MTWGAIFARPLGGGAAAAGGGGKAAGGEGFTSINAARDRQALMEYHDNGDDDSDSTSAERIEMTRGRDRDDAILAQSVSKEMMEMMNR